MGNSDFSSQGTSKSCRSRLEFPIEVPGLMQSADVEFRAVPAGTWISTTTFDMCVIANFCEFNGPLLPACCVAEAL
jgi:hypothetical protein